MHRGSLDALASYSKAEHPCHQIGHKGQCAAYLSHLSEGRLRRWSSALHAEHATGEGIHQAEGCACALHHVKADPC